MEYYGSDTIFKSYRRNLADIVIFRFDSPNHSWSAVDFKTMMFVF